MVKLPETVFDTFMVDCLRHAQDYNPNIVQILNQETNNHVVAAMTSHAAFTVKQPTTMSTNNNTTTLSANVENTLNTSPVGGLYDNAPPDQTDPVATVSEEQSELDYLQAAQQIDLQQNTTN